ncbi:mov34 family protein [hydrocarbon metagenome]|uniref:Mov34 family protein n=1 Tax=hydrocarbon metagenome TaxID=938273 RepID=A0A0W8FE22_9ZZZZ
MLCLGKEQHPYEFVAVLQERNNIIEDLNLVPGTISNESSASVLIDMLPLDTHRIGSAHSHPNGVLTPSPADLGFFPRMGRYHIIVGHPYGRKNWRCYTAGGSPYDLKVIE